MNSELQNFALSDFWTWWIEAFSVGATTRERQREREREVDLDGEECRGKGGEECLVVADTASIRRERTAEWLLGAGRGQSQVVVGV